MLTPFRHVEGAVWALTDPLRHSRGDAADPTVVLSIAFRLEVETGGALTATVLIPDT
jgi:hypothetical protein